MLKLPIQATVFYRHSEEEVAELAQAIKPLDAQIRAVSSEAEQEQLLWILEGKYFRRRDVTRVVRMLSRAAKYARGHLSEHFWPDTVIAQAEVLEDAVRRYRDRFQSLQDEVIPVN